jgi:putative colanic acid biosynthesis acetyltransferase WcaF
MTNQPSLQTRAVAPGEVTEDGLGGLDIAANRRARKWSPRALAGRGLWELTGFAFAWSPRQLWGWRNAMLRLFGARIGRDVHVHPTVRIAVPWNLVIGDHTAVGDGAILYSLGTITLGASVTISQYAHLCAGTHDHRQADLPLVKAPITIDDGAWICADAFVGPGAVVGAYAIVGARAVVVGEVEARTIVAGNPARRLAVRPPLAPR